MTVEVPGLDEPVCVRTSAHRHVTPGQLIFLDVDPSGVVVICDDDRCR
jgi:hypothetical protein